ncbi:MAG: NfeD family protein, partial [Chloroflexota bacterium]
RDLQLRTNNKNPAEQFLEFISDPNVSAILLMVGALGIVIELFNPGLIVPGVVGGIALLLAFLALGNLPFNWAGVAFILLAVVLAVLELQVAGFGILGVGAVISLIGGGLLLFAQFGDVSPTLPRVAVSRWLLIGMAAALGLAALSLARLVYQSRKLGGQAIVSSLVGTAGTVAAVLAPRGVVQVGDETWTAVSEDDSVIPVGEKVRVTRVDGLILTVSRRRDGDTDIP